MVADVFVAYEPRKTTIQARSAVTVEAIFEATIQVLLSHGAERLTTTRIAARAGVSVGTLYQYYPNKQSLLLAVLENHLTNVAGKVEADCKSASHKPLAQMIKEMVEAFVDAKMERSGISVAPYRVSAEEAEPHWPNESVRGHGNPLRRCFRQRQTPSRHPTISPST